MKLPMTGSSRSGKRDGEAMSCLLAPPKPLRKKGSEKARATARQTGGGGGGVASAENGAGRK